MITRTFGICLLCTGLFTLARTVVSGSAPACSYAYSPYFQSPDMTYALATALDSTLTDQTDSLAVTSTRRVLLPTAARGTVEGQLLRLQSVHGVGADTLSKRLVAGDSIAILIRWGLGSDCSATPVSPAIPAGEFNHFIVALRPSGAWVQGHPTLEVGPTSFFGVYPGWLRTQLGANASMLNPVEFSSFLDLLPTGAEWSSDCRGAVKRLKGWAHDHKALSKKYPVPDALRELGVICDKRPS